MYLSIEKPMTKACFSLLPTTDSKEKFPMKPLASQCD